MKKEKRRSGIENDDIDVVADSTNTETNNVESIISSILCLQNLQLLRESEFANAVHIFVEKDEKEAIERFIDSSLETTRQHMEKNLMRLEDDAIAHEVSLELEDYVFRSIPVYMRGPIGSGKDTLVKDLASNEGKNSLDVKVLLGNFLCTEIPGEFHWKPGLLSLAVENGFWLLFEEFDPKNADLIAALRPILEDKILTIPSRSLSVPVHEDFRLFLSSSLYPPDMKMSFFGHFGYLELDVPSSLKMKSMLETAFPEFIESFVPFVINVYDFIPVFGTRRVLYSDLYKILKRMQYFPSSFSCMNLETRERFLWETCEVLYGSIPDLEKRKEMYLMTARFLNIPTEKVIFGFLDRKPSIDNHHLGRVELNNLTPSSICKFVLTGYTSRIMEMIAMAIKMGESILLVGETGTGKTTVVQQLASIMNIPLTVVNLHSHSEVSDLLGTYKHTSLSLLISKSYIDLLETLFEESGFSKLKNITLFEKIGQWKEEKNWILILSQICQTARYAKNKFDRDREIEKHEYSKNVKCLYEKWTTLEERASRLSVYLESIGSETMACRCFAFIEGVLLRAVKEGTWILLDEVNLASIPVLQIIEGCMNECSLFVLERGDHEPVIIHPDFRLFCCMNPSTDMTKRDLPVSLRQAFTEIYVDSLDLYPDDLRSIIREAIPDISFLPIVYSLFYDIKVKVRENIYIDGGGNKPDFSLRNLIRMLRVWSDSFSKHFTSERALYESIMIAFGSILDLESISILISHMKELGISCRSDRNFLTMNKHCVLIQGFLAKKGSIEPHTGDSFILTPSVGSNVEKVARVLMGSPHLPILIEGPTSSGKSSIVEYLGSITGNTVMRINNHEHTDLQEYVGSFGFSPSGRIIFQYGPLVRALREGSWLLLDELNLAPSDVLESLNRLLDDNRQLFIPETEELIIPHPRFRLFATQNPSKSGYGGRKQLSRAFKNRFVQLFFTEIPEDEILDILCKRFPLIPVSFCQRIRMVYSELLRFRTSASNFLCKKHAFITLRDLFKWSNRSMSTYEEVYQQGWCLIGEKIRTESDKATVFSILNKIFAPHVKSDLNSWLFLSPFPLDDKLVWTRHASRIANLVFRCIENQEPVLLVGDTGCGKTTIVEWFSKMMNRPLLYISAHQYTDASDFLGMQRPYRSRDRHEHLEKKTKLDYEDTSSDIRPFFEWMDGPLIQAMKTGSFFLIDEISLADDAVLERLNPVLEDKRRITLGEPGSCSTIVADHSFNLFATMNPSGDFGKRELSLALRNRFTEIWIPALNDYDDILVLISGLATRILSNRHKNFHGILPELILDFVSIFLKNLNTVFLGGEPIWSTSISSLCLVTPAYTVSIRDFESWIEFISLSSDFLSAYIHGAQMVFLDGLSMLPVFRETAYQIHSFETDAIEFLKNQISMWELTNGMEFEPKYMIDTEEKWGIEPFLIQKNYSSKDILENKETYSFEPKTVFLNTFRLLRAMQIRKPILLEGEPGVGKTSLVAHIARVSGHQLTRINLSEQTDLTDLFGLDLPGTEGFSWIDGPFLSALKQGHWILLDEVNLASQAILEGLNAVLDHRGQVFIPELDKTFSIPNNGSRIFATQNPQRQGGGRKGLARSFLNRFIRVYLKPLNADDLASIAQMLSLKFGKIPSQTIKCIILLVETLKSVFRTFDFNLRDVMRCLHIISMIESKNPEQWLLATRKAVQIAFGARLTNFESVSILASRFSELFSVPFFEQIDSFKVRIEFPSNIVWAQRKSYEALFYGIELNMLCILSSPITGAFGKSFLIRELAKRYGKKLHIVPLTPASETMDFLGNFEQMGTKCSFEWKDGALLEAMRMGEWILFDNANSCPSAVLDRLNSLFEDDGFLNAHECGSLLSFKKPHDEFRAFMITNQTGTLSRPMRNRGLEICVDDPFVLKDVFVESELVRIVGSMEISIKLSRNPVLGLHRLHFLREEMIQITELDISNNNNSDNNNFTFESVLGKFVSELLNTDFCNAFKNSFGTRHFHLIKLYLDLYSKNYGLTDSKYKCTFISGEDGWELDPDAAFPFLSLRERTNNDVGKLCLELARVSCGRKSIPLQGMSHYYKLWKALISESKISFEGVFKPEGQITKRVLLESAWNSDVSIFSRFGLCLDDMNISKFMEISVWLLQDVDFSLPIRSFSALNQKIIEYGTSKHLLKQISSNIDFKREIQYLVDKIQVPGEITWPKWIPQWMRMNGKDMLLKLKTWPFADPKHIMELKSMAKIESRLIGIVEMVFACTFSMTYLTKDGTETMPLYDEFEYLNSTFPFSGLWDIDVSRPRQLIIQLLRDLKGGHVSFDRIGHALGKLVGYVCPQVDYKELRPDIIYPFAFALIISELFREENPSEDSLSSIVCRDAMQGKWSEKSIRWLKNLTRPDDLYLFSSLWRCENIDSLPYLFDSLPCDLSQVDIAIRIRRFCEHDSLEDLFLEVANVIVKMEKTLFCEVEIKLNALLSLDLRKIRDPKERLETVLNLSGLLSSLLESISEYNTISNSKVDILEALSLLLKLRMTEISLSIKIIQEIRHFGDEDVVSLFSLILDSCVKMDSSFHLFEMLDAFMLSGNTGSFQGRLDLLGCLSDSFPLRILKHSVAYFKLFKQPLQIHLETEKRRSLSLLKDIKIEHSDLDGCNGLHSSTSKILHDWTVLMASPVSTRILSMQLEIPKVFPVAKETSDALLLQLESLGNFDSLESFFVAFEWLGLGKNTKCINLFSMTPFEIFSTVPVLPSGLEILFVHLVNMLPRLGLKSRKMGFSIHRTLSRCLKWISSFLINIPAMIMQSKDKPCLSPVIVECLRVRVLRWGVDEISRDILKELDPCRLMTESSDENNNIDAFLNRYIKQILSNGPIAFSKSTLTSDSVDMMESIPFTNFNGFEAGEELRFGLPRDFIITTFEWFGRQICPTADQIKYYEFFVSHLILLVIGIESFLNESNDLEDGEGEGEEGVRGLANEGCRKGKNVSMEIEHEEQVSDLAHEAQERDEKMEKNDESVSTTEKMNDMEDVEDEDEDEDEDENLDENESMEHIENDGENEDRGGEEEEELSRENTSVGTDEDFEETHDEDLGDLEEDVMENMDSYPIGTDKMDEKKQDYSGEEMEETQTEHSEDSQNDSIQDECDEDVDFDGKEEGEEENVIEMESSTEEKSCVEEDQNPLESLDDDVVSGDTDAEEEDDALNGVFFGDEKEDVVENGEMNKDVENYQQDGNGAMNQGEFEVQSLNNKQQDVDSSKDPSVVDRDLASKEFQIRNDKVLFEETKNSEEAMEKKGSDEMNFEKIEYGDGTTAAVCVPVVSAEELQGNNCDDDYLRQRGQNQVGQMESNFEFHRGRRDLELDASLENEETEETQNHENVRIDIEEGKLVGDLGQNNSMVWTGCLGRTCEMAAELAEHLRIVLEPTSAGKLEGDYRSGKRLNMRRVVGYIASEFRRDRIWLRRTKLSKRALKVLLSIDLSRSMLISGASTMAMDAVALLWQALNRIEAGEISVAGFGDGVRQFVPFGGNMEELENLAGNSNGFESVSTDLGGILLKSIDWFRNEDGGKIQFVITDGIFDQGQMFLKGILNSLKEEGVLVVFLLLNESILELQSVSLGGEGNVSVSRYLDTFPGEYYVVVRNLSSLPEVLGTALCEWVESHTQK